MSKRRGKGRKQNAREFFARCASGFESVLAQELRALGAERVRPLKGGVAFFGGLEQGYQACLWCRCATRIQLVLARVPAATADVLYQGVYELPWERHLKPRATIAVDAHGLNAQLRNTKFTALKVKDALCDRLRDVTGERPNVDAHNPDFSLNVALHEQKATLYLNLSGNSLHRRGYRQEGVQTEAPLKETLAAGILLMAGWPELALQGGVLVDPMCGSGTFAIEAAWMASNVAPGLLRQRWGFDGWQGHDAALWERVRSEAQQAVRSSEACILAGDLNEQALAIAGANARRAGVEEQISFAVADAARLGERLEHRGDLTGQPGLMVANPPYGQRLLSADDLPQVRRALAQAVEALPSGWRVALVTPDTGADTALGRLPYQTVACYNGPLKAWIRLYEAAGESRQTTQVVSLGGVTREVGLANPQSTQFAARLRKVGKERVRWARREQVSCYRVYDGDLPEYAVSVDVYDAVTEAGLARHALVRERHRPGSVDALVAGRRFADAVALVAAVLDVAPERVVSRSQDDAEAGRGATGVPAEVRVTERGLTFALDLSDPYDVVMPLALRGVRAYVGGLTPVRRTACLFAHNSAATVVAVASGSGTIEMVDAFQDRLDGVRDMLALNGFGAAAPCRLACSDVRTWLAREARAHKTYDRILCCPPAWLPGTDKAQGDWDRARDLAELVRLAARVLAPGGTLLIAYEGAPQPPANLGAREGLAVRDLSAQTLTHDCARTAQEHRCIELTKPPLA